MQAGPSNDTSTSDALHLLLKDMAQDNLSEHHFHAGYLYVESDGIGASKSQVAHSLIDFLKDDQLSEEYDAEFSEPEDGDDSFDYHMQGV